MTVLSWNCRDLGKFSTVLQCHKIAQEYRPDVLFLMEIRLAKDKGEEMWFIYLFIFFYGWELPRDGLSGGILLVWMPNQRLQIIYASKNLVRTNLLDNKGTPLSITFVYGHPILAKREDVWNKLKDLKLLTHPNWLCIGDFNQVLSNDDKFSFNQGALLRVDSLHNVISELSLCELAAFGQRFTWMNKTEEGDFVMERLDRAFASVAQINAYPNYALKNLPIVHSDYSPIILDFDFKLPYRKRTFRFGIDVVITFFM